jgi:uncharacterized SAM-binding protein YcdF (DUF218 family)
VKSVVKKMKSLIIFRKIFCIIIFFFGAIFLFAIILAFTSLPFHIWYNHGLTKAGIHRPPDYIVILGGGGMPSESGLMRTWYGAKAANYFSKARVIIALPGNSQDSLSSINLMKKELVLRRVNQDRIFLEDSGTNTRAQAVNIHKIITNYELRITNKLSIVNCPLSILIVTSPEHLTRSVLTFKKAGFLKVDGLPAFEITIESDIIYNDRHMGGRKWIPGIGGNITLRYQFWTQLRYEELLIREYLALFYYKLKGWI